MPSNVPNKPLQDYPFPSIIADSLLEERSSSWTENFQPVEPGTPFKAPPTHSVAEAAKYSGTISLGQRAGKDNEFQQRFWATIPHTQDVYNYEQEDDQQAYGYPSFNRKYFELRDQYPTLKRVPLTPLTGLYGIRITAGGSGYLPAPSPPPNVACNNGATAIAVVDPADGSIAKITLKAEGANCTTVVTIDAPPVGGTQATATGILQPASCVLVSETAVPAPAPWDSLYLLVTRVYKTLPGPIITEFSAHNNGIPILISRQERASTDLFTDGEFVPPLINVSSITTGASVVVTLAADHGLPLGAYVTFAGTNSTPPIDGNLRITAIPASNEVTVTPAAPVTIAGTLAGTMKGTNRIVRELKPTKNANIKIKIESMLAVADLSPFFENVLCSKEYPFPDFLKLVTLYIDIARSSSTGNTSSTSKSWGGAPGLPRQYGYRGPCPARRLRRYFDGPPPDSFAGANTVTISIATPAVVLWTAHGLAAGDPVSFDTTGALPTGLTKNIQYYVSSTSLAADSFCVSSTVANALAGTNINTSGTQSGVQSAYRFRPTFIMVSGGTISIEGGASSFSRSGGGTNHSESQSNSWRSGSIGPCLHDDNLAITYVSASGVMLGSIAITSIVASSSSVATVQTATPHGLNEGDYVTISGSATVPSVDGLWSIHLINSTSFQIFPPLITTGSTNHGTMLATGQAKAFLDLPNSFPAKLNQGDIIVLMEQPQKTGVAGLWEWYFWFIYIPYTSGQAPA